LPDKEIKAILFDLGETLLAFGKVDMSKLYRQGAKLSYEFLRDLGQPVGNFRRYCRRNLWAIRMRYWLSVIRGRDFDSLELLRRIGTKVGYKLKEEQWQHLSWLWYEPLSKFGRAEPNIIETLTKLKNMGLELGIVSNTFIHGSSLNRHLEKLGISDFFPVKLYSYEFSFRKPDARIFKAAAERIGQNPEKIMFVGDRIGVDIRPALRLGMTAVLKEAYTNAGKKVPDGAHKIKYLSELPAFIKKTNA